MPNWCHNSLVFRGSQPDLLALFRKIHGDHCHLGFGKVVPEPAGLSGKKTEGSMLPDWYAWRCENWGTKWDIDHESSDSLWVAPQFGSVALSFETAWSPSLPVTAAAAKMFPSVSMDHLYCDEGMGTAGRAIWTGGKLASFQDCSHGTVEYDMVSRGIRPEESSVAECDWERDIPTARAFSKLERSRPPDPAPRRPQTLESLSARIVSAHCMGEIASSFALARSIDHGFPVQAWRRAGLPEGPALSWSSVGFPWSAAPQQGESTFYIRHEYSPKLASGPSRRPPPRLLLVERTPLPSTAASKEMGRIEQLESGLEIVSPTGWSVAAITREDEAVVMVSKDGSCQSPPDGSPSCVHWKKSPSTGRPFLFATAFCSGGKLWDPEKGTPAYAEYLESGAVRRTASFFAGRLSGGSVRSAVREFIDGTPRRPLPRSRAKGGSTSPRMGRLV